MRKIIPLSISLIGFTAMASQIVLMREFLIVFYGNELSIGFILANWLIGGAIGSGLLGALSDRIRHKHIAFSLCQLALGALLPVSIFMVRSIKTALGINTGEIVPFFPILLSSFIILAPICIILGFMFSLACRIYSPRSGIGAVKIGKVYVLEAVGSIAGGLLASFIIIRIFNSVQIMSILSMLNIIVSMALFASFGESKKKIYFIGAFIALIIIEGAMWVSGAWDFCNRYSMSKQWQGYELVSSKNSIYGNVAVVRRGSQTSFFDNGLRLYTIPDKLTSEEAVHFALLEHRDPENVLLVGGGVGGLMHEILKEPVRRVDYLELDPLVIKMAEEYLPAGEFEPLKDIRVSVKNVDGRLFIKMTDKKYDCVIIHLGDPYTAQLNRYYTVEFFREVKKILKKGGVISFGLTSSESYINKELGDFLRSIYLTLTKVFEDVKIIPGETAYFLASSGKGVLTYDYNILTERVKERGLDLDYVREYYLFSKLSSEKVSYIEDSVTNVKRAVKINYDFRPISYYYDIIFWSIRFRDSLFSELLKAMTETRVWATVIGIYAFIGLFGASMLRRKSLFKKAVIIAVMATGFSVMVFQILILLSFQIIYGYMFYKLGIILTAFMIGLAAGGWWVTKIMPGLKNDAAAFMWSQCAICIYPLSLPIFFGRLAGSASSGMSWLGSNILFLVLPVLAGFIGGFQLPLANKIYLGKEREVGSAAGLSYGSDLLGSCLGALLTGALLIPIIGIPKTCLLIAVMNSAVLILLIFSAASCKPVN